MEMKSIKILLINDFLYGGGAEVVFREINHILNNNRIRVDIFYKEEKQKLIQSPLSYIYSFSNKRKLKRLFRNNCYDIVIVLNYASAFSPSILSVINDYKQRQGFKVIYNAHDAHLICPNSGLNYFQNGKMKRFDEKMTVSTFLSKRLDYRGHVFSILKKIQWVNAYKVLKLQNTIDIIVTPSYFLKERINSFYPDKDIKVIRNPAIDHCFKQPSRIGLKGEILHIIFFGRLSDEKGLIPFIEALKSVTIPFIFDIYGEGKIKNDIEKAIFENNLQSKISLKGSIDHGTLLQKLNNYDAMVLPSIMYENAPLSIVEAAASQMHILTMQYGGMEELAKCVGNYYFIDPLSSEKLDSIFAYLKDARFEPSDLSEFTKTVFEKRILNLLNSIC